MSDTQGALTTAPKKDDEDLKGHPSTFPNFEWHKYYERGLLRPIALFSLLTSLYLAALWLIVWAESALLKIALGIFLSIICGKLFVMGHDAAHNSLSPHKPINYSIGVVVFAASFHVFSLWKYAHNQLHHAFTNVRGYDFVWRPLDKDEYDNLSSFSQKVQKLYRHHSGIGLCPYYFIEILLKRMILPMKRNLPNLNPADIVEFCITYLIWIAIISFLTYGGLLVHNRPLDTFVVFVNLAVGFLGPILYVCWAIGFVVYFNHTHPEIPWYEKYDHWNFWKVQKECTLYLRFLGISQFLLPSEVMNHVVHHMDTRIPVWYLRRAQEDLYRFYPSSIKVEIWSSALRTGIMLRCKLYNYRRNQWTDFNGNPTGPMLQA
jgi:omega-6 fatty acid desaturase (delta-12 desaturase)